MYLFFIRAYSCYSWLSAFLCNSWLMITGRWRDRVNCAARLFCAGNNRNGQKMLLRSITPREKRATTCHYERSASDAKNLYNLNPLKEILHPRLRRGSE